MKKLYPVFILIWVIILTFSPAIKTPKAEDTEVMVENFAFSPKEVAVPVGGTVTWIQKDRAPHTITAVNGDFDSGRLTKGDKFAHTFSKKGTYNYLCKFHPSMRGKVIVQ